MNAIDYVINHHFVATMTVIFTVIMVLIAILIYWTLTILEEEEAEKW